MTSEVTYRTATVDDAPAIAHVEVNSKRESIADFESSQSMDYDRCLMRWSSYLAGTRSPKLAKPPRAVFLASSESSVIGYVGCHHAFRHDWWPADAELQQIYVLRQHQRRGIGKRLLVQMIDWLKASDITSVGVGFHADNPYRAFYLKMGFQLSGPGMAFLSNLDSWSPPADEYP